ncbi:MAG: TaqI-like C-terminal specificity domain-containing protein [Euryarchaeota archaeon]|nr:TaqI-like C-terminal specificity domain-containing protein [Euryarchaeota archaeon]
MKEQAKQKVKELVDRFMYNLDVYKKSAYNEAQVRREFIGPFFEALGWDVSNRQGFAEQYKEVVLEDTIKVGRSTRAPDYSFRIGGQRKFFVEAKKPAVNIKEDVSPAYQLRRYAWSAKLPLSVVTDFEEFSVFDCRIKPNPNDKSSVGRIAYYTFDEYLDGDKFDEIYDVFSKEAVLKGGFDKYAESTKGKKGTAEVDSEFLKEIESWRELLAKNIALRNPDVSIYELNYAVQKIIDRIIFLRICEDRAIEPYGQLQTKAESGDVYTHLLNHFKLAESKYNSGIFDFYADKITTSLSIDDRVLKTIIQSLYYPKSPYEFSVLGVEILGNVYEQFLGKVIRLTAGHQAKVETKPEVKKAGGVYYTPQYIVDYIVKNTVGKLVEGNGKTPEEIAKIKILDPACGSGSFLIGAYTYLLRYHLDWYLNNKPKQHKEAVFQVRENEWYLTTAEKKRILLNNIFGVDIDPQAVEVTKLSLLLKVLENESRESIDQQVKLGLEGVLPNLGGNVKCGNSLIGADFYGTGQQETLFDEAEIRRVNVFDWEDDVKGFGEIMKRGGFDCVIGNPPYVRQELLKEQKEYFKTHYHVYHGTADLYAYFIEKGVSLLSSEGLFSIIVANKWMRANYGKTLRQWLKTKRVEEIVDFGDLSMFKNTTTYPCIIRISSGKLHPTFEVTQVETLEFPDLETYVEEHQYALNQDELDDGGWSLVDEQTAALLKKLQQVGIPLGEYVQGKIYRGIVTGLNYAFVIDAETRKRLIIEDPKSAELIKPFLVGRDIKRYQLPQTDKYLIFTRRGVNIKEYPAIESYLKQFKEKLMSKPKDWEGDKWPGRKPGSYKWYEIQDTIDYYTEFEKPKICWGNLCNVASFTIDFESLYINAPACILNSNDKYLLGCMNSKLLWRFLQEIAAGRRGGFIEAKPFYVEQLPIRIIDFSNPAEKAQHDKLVALVDNMLELQKKHHNARMERDKELYERQIKIVDAQIDRLVYELYGLTEEEVKVVEGGF